MSHVVVFRTSSGIEASIVRGLLDSQGFNTLVTAEGPRRLFPVSVNSLGEVRIAVRADEADEACALIEGYRAEGGSGQVIAFDQQIAALERRMGYRFSDRTLLERALTHRSRAQEDGTGETGDNESLEFLGDAVLGFVVADLLFREFAEHGEGHKSKIKAALVSAPSLAQVGEQIGLGEHLRLGRGEEKTGGRQKHALLANACEALIAAIYLDGGLAPARAFVLGQLRPVIDRAREPGILTALTGDYKSALQEWLQSRDETAPDYRVVSEEGPDHQKHFVVEVLAGGRALASASGRSKKEAEQQAARAALDSIDAAGPAE